MPDLTHGLAGIGLVHLRLDETYIASARTLGDALIARAEEIPGGVAWRHPPGNHVGMSGEILLGFAHGSAGIAYFLLQLWKATGVERYLTTALEAASIIRDNAVPCLEDQKGVNWPVSITTVNSDETWFYWCHGAAGIGLFLLEAWQFTGDAKQRELAEAAARSISLAGKRGGGLLCHGLPGNGAFLLRAYQKLREQKYLNAAFEFADALELFTLTNEHGVAWPSEQPTVTTPDYMVGYAGAADFYLMLAGAENESCAIRIPVF